MGILGEFFVPSVLGIGMGLAFGVYVTRKFMKKSINRTDILLVGQPRAGKTTLFYQLLKNQMEHVLVGPIENIGVYNLRWFRKYVLVDVPGQSRTRELCLKRYRNTTKAIVFVIDSATIEMDLKKVAEYLFQLLSDKHLADCRFLVLCSKQDLASAKPSWFIRELLERKLHLLCMQHNTNLWRATGDGATEGLYTDQKFAQKLEYCECNAANGIGPLQVWLSGL